MSTGIDAVRKQAVVRDENRKGGIAGNGAATARARSTRDGPT
jgi:hypothetical protein